MPEQNTKPNTAQKVLVTGHDGYIGSVLTGRLLALGLDVWGLDTMYCQDCAFGDKPQSLKFIAKDVRDILPEDVRGFDAIIHLAALSNDPVGQLAEDLTLDINHGATVRLAEMAKAAGVRRFLYASSCSLYGKSEGDWMDESSPQAPLTAYARSKVKSEQDLQRLASESFSPVILRCATVFGIAPKLRVDLVVNNLAAWGITTGKIQIMSDGTPWRPLIHVEDLVSAYEFFLSAPLEAVHNQVFNIGFNECNYQVREIAETVGKYLPGTEVVFAAQPDKDSRSYRVSFNKFHDVSGLEPEFNLEKGICQIVQAYKAHGLSHEDFVGRKYVRLSQMQHLIKNGLIDAQLRWTRA